MMNEKIKTILRIVKDGTKKWYLNGAQYSEEEFNNRMNPKELTVNQIEELLGYKIKVVGNDFRRY